MDQILCVIGAGQMGSSIVRGALDRGLFDRIIIIEPNAQYRDQLAAYIGEGRARVDSHDSIATADIETADMVVLATPISQFSAVTDEIAPRLRKGAILTDVGSAKFTSMKNINDVLDRSGRNDHDIFYIPSHPGVGNAGQGPMTGSADMYQGNPVFVVPPGTEASSEKRAACETVKTFWSNLGADTTEIDAFSHDRFFGTTSHFQHAAVFALTALGKDPEKSGLTGGYGNARTWMRNVTRIARANPDMWVPVFHENKTAILEAAEGFSKQLEAIRSALVQPDKPLALKGLLIQAHNYRTGMKDHESRESVAAEVFDWAEFHKVDLPALPAAKDVSTLFNAESGSDFIRGTLLPTALSAALTLNAKEIDLTKVKGIDIAQKANPSFLDGSAPMLSDPQYLADLLFCNKDALLPVLDAYQEKFDDVIHAIKVQDDQKIRDLINAVSDIRAQMPAPRKHMDARPGMEPVREKYLAGRPGAGHLKSLSN